ncbi:MAG: hypothetical protein ACREMW_09570 [Gemmatimonadales bacterium]
MSRRTALATGRIIAIGMLLAPPTELRAQARSACDERPGRGRLAVTIRSRAGQSPTVTLRGPNGATQTVSTSDTLDLAAGEYRVSASPPRVVTSGVRIGYAHGAVVSPSSVCVRPGTVEDLSVGWALEPGSHHLWVADQRGPVMAYDVETLVAGGNGAAAIRFAGGVTTARGAAFDPQGHLWVGDGPGALVSFNKWGLGEHGDREPRVYLSGPATDGLRGMAFDPHGNLWISQLGEQRVVRFTPQQLASSGRPTPAVAIAGIEAPFGLAFDAAGNLWVANEGRPSTVLRYDARRLGATTTAPADVTITAMSGPPVIDVLAAPHALAFDRDGNLWVAYFGPNVIARFTPAEQARGGEITPSVQISVSTAGLLESLAFDEDGNLWFTFDQGAIAMFAPEALHEGGVKAPTRVLRDAGLEYPGALAFDPPATWSPVAR